MMLPEHMVTPLIFGKDGSVPVDGSVERWFPRSRPESPSSEYLLGLGCPSDLIPLIQSLGTPDKLQAFIDSNLRYNKLDTTRGFVGIARTLEAHCFEGAMFAYTVLWANGWNPRVVLLQADNEYGEDHNIVVYRQGNRLGSVAMSSWETLKAAPPVFPSLRDLVFGWYWRAYTSELPQYSGVFNLVGFSDPVDLVDKFGHDWVFNEGDQALWLVFQRYTDQLYCTHLATGERYLYPADDFSPYQATGEER